MTSGFYYRAHRTRLQEMVQPVGVDGGRAVPNIMLFWHYSHKKSPSG
jgi:hypothetical protein